MIGIATLVHIWPLSFATSATHLIVRLEHRHHDVNCDEPIGVHGTHVIADELVVGDSHHHENQKVETKHHP